jgi:hypothetical protein
MCKEMPVILVNKVVDKKRIIRKNGELRRRRRRRGTKGIGLKNVHCVVKQLDSFGQTNLSQLMYFDCGPLLLYQTRQSQAYIRMESDAMTYSKSETV